MEVSTFPLSVTSSTCQQCYGSNCLSERLYDVFNRQWCSLPMGNISMILYGNDCCLFNEKEPSPLLLIGGILQSSLLYLLCI